MVIFEAVDSSCGLLSTSVSARVAKILACCLYQGNVEANANFEKEEALNYAHEYCGK